MSSEQEAFTRLAEPITNLQASSQNHQPYETLVSAFLVKLSEFWSDDPKIWFVGVEEQLRSRSITGSITQDQTKFDTSQYNSCESQVCAFELGLPNVLYFEEQSFNYAFLSLSFFSI